MLLVILLRGVFSALTMLIFGSFYLQNEVLGLCEMINYAI